MAESPAPENAAKTIGRPFTKGGPPGPGRPRLPEWFTEKAPSALAMMVAAATGEVVEGFTDNAAIVEMAASCPQALRVQAADKLADRVFGKAKETHEHTGEVGHVTRVVLEVERKPEAKTVEGTVARPKALHGADAE